MSNPRTGARAGKRVADVLSIADARKLHTAMVSNNTGADLYIIVIEGTRAASWQGQALTSDIPLIGWVKIPTGDTGSIDWGDSGRPSDTGFTVIAATSLTPMVITDITFYDGSVCDVTYS